MIEIKNKIHTRIPVLVNILYNEGNISRYTINRIRRVTQYSTRFDRIEDMSVTTKLYK